jgi:hypothetical protein
MGMRYLIVSLADQYSEFVFTRRSLSSVNQNFTRVLLIPAKSGHVTIAGLNGA